MSVRRHLMTTPCTVKMRQAREQVVPVIFAYDLDRPWEVELQVESSTRGVFAKFPISRELLALGCGAASGDGRVRVYPDDGTLVITLTDDRGVIVFRALKLQVDGFMGRTYNMRPVQADDPSEDMLPEHEAELDRWLAHFMREAS